MKLRTTAATAVAATAAVLAVGAAPADAATAGAIAKPTSLTLKAGTTAAKYGHLVELSAHLGRTASNRTIEIDNGRSIVKKGRVDAHGNLTAWVTATHNTTFVAKFTGDSRDKAASARVRVNVAAQITAGFINGVVGNDGSTTYYGADGMSPQLKVDVTPDKTGEPITAHMQAQLNDGSWVDVKLSDPVTKLLSGSSEVLTFHFGGPPRGAVFLRESVSYAGDATNTGSSTAWQYALYVPA